ncbi:hypothetical protein SGPA1_90009 [Streptomyces misionensis JCM 4497]
MVVELTRRCDNGAGALFPHLHQKSARLCAADRPVVHAVSLPRSWLLMPSNITPSQGTPTPEQPHINGHTQTERTCDRFGKADRASKDTYPYTPALEAPHSAVHATASAA